MHEASRVIFDKLSHLFRVCRLSPFPLVTLKCVVGLSEKQQGVPGNSIPLGALQTSSPSLCRPHAELIQPNSNPGHNFEVKNATSCVDWIFLFEEFPQLPR